MSDLSNIAHDYELNADFARRFNNAVLNLKRVHLLHRPATREVAKENENSRSDLCLLLESLLLSLTHEGKTWTEKQAQIPVDVLDRLHVRQKGELPELILELRRARDGLTHHQSLDKTAFAALDRVCEAADATASAAFRRLRRI